MDIATILFLQKASYRAGAFTLLYVRLRSSDSKGSGSLAASFILLSIASTLAGYAESQSDWYATLSLTNLVLAVFGYSLLGTSFIEISNPRRKAPAAMVLVPAALTLLLGVATQFHTTNSLRAIFFHLVAATILVMAAVVVTRDAKREPLPVRKLVASVLGACAAICLVVAGEFLTESFAVLDIPTAFMVMILTNFVLSLSVVIFITERQQFRLRQLAERDSLTGLYNRHYFNYRVTARLAPGDFILYLDLDHFKRINDAWGHAGGDDVLITVAHALNSLLRKDAVLARQGGEEFVVYLPARLGDGVTWAERLREGVQRTRYPSLSETLSVTISVGIAKADERSSLSELCASADKALYQAKALGRNRACMETTDSEHPLVLRSA